MNDAASNPAETPQLPADVPDPKFAAHLEWQLRTALRRESRFAEPVADAVGGASRAWRVARIAAALVGAIVIGAGGVLAAQEIGRSRSAELLAVQYQIRFEIAGLRAKAAQEEIEELMQLQQRGQIPAHELYAVEERRVALAEEASVLGLDAIEVGYTGQEPDRRLSAARVADRDLVTERLDQRVAALKFRRSAADRRVEELQQLHAAGVIPADELERARFLARSVAAEAAVVAKEKELRAKFLRGELDAGRVDLLALREEALARRERAADEVKLADTALKLASERHKMGVMPQREMRQAEHDAAAAVAQRRLADLEVETIDARLEEK
jgi:hypothetical protein